MDVVCFAHFDLETCFAPQWRALFRHLNFQKSSERGVFFAFLLTNVLRAKTACTFWIFQLSKVRWTWCVLHILTWKRASRHNGVHFFDISTSKNRPNVECFVLFYLQMCFAPQLRALFEYFNFQKCDGRGVFCTFWLGNVLRATTACIFSTSQLPKIVRTWSVFCFFTYKCASRQNGVHFFDISTSKNRPNVVCFAHFDLETCFAPQRRALFRHLNFQTWSEREVFLASYLQTCFAPQWRALFRHLNFQKWSERGVFCTFCLGIVLRATTACTFSSLIWPACSAPAALASLFFNHPEPQIIRKNTMNCDFPTFSRTCLFFLLTLSLLWSSHCFSSRFWLFPPLLFPSVHIVGKLTSKLPSMKVTPPHLVFI